MSRIFEKTRAIPGAQANVASPWILQCDIFETSENFFIKAEAPGVELDDISLEVADCDVTISGRRKRDAGVEEENYHRVERTFGMFSRSFTLPSGVNENKVSASLKDGVLTVTLPKKVSRGKSRILDIKVD